MELSLAEAMKLKKKMPGSVFVGTKGETDRLRNILAAYSNPCRSRKFFTLPQPSPNSRSGSKKFTNDARIAIRLESFNKQNCKLVLPGEFY
jgi:hypothetical protein